MAVETDIAPEELVDIAFVIAWAEIKKDGRKLIVAMRKESRAALISFIRSAPSLFIVVRFYFAISSLTKHSNQLIRN